MYTSQMLNHSCLSVWLSVQAGIQPTSVVGDETNASSCLYPCTAVAKFNALALTYRYSGHRSCFFSQHLQYFLYINVYWYPSPKITLKSKAQNKCHHVFQIFKFKRNPHGDYYLKFSAVDINIKYWSCSGMFLLLHIYTLNVYATLLFEFTWKELKP